MRDDDEASVTGTIEPEPRAGRLAVAAPPAREDGAHAAAERVPVPAGRGDRPAREDVARRRALVPRFGLPLGLAALLLLAALWPRAPFMLDVGAPGDRLFLANVNGDERDIGYSYRWTGWKKNDTALTVPGWGAVRRARHAARAGPPRPRPR